MDESFRTFYFRARDVVCGVDEIKFRKWTMAKVEKKICIAIVNSDWDNSDWRSRLRLLSRHSGCRIFGRTIALRRYGKYSRGRLHVEKRSQLRAYCVDMLKTFMRVLIWWSLSWKLFDLCWCGRQWHQSCWLQWAWFSERAVSLHMNLLGVAGYR